MSITEKMNFVPFSFWTCLIALLNLDEGLYAFLTLFCCQINREKYLDLQDHDMFIWCFQVGLSCRGETKCAFACSYNVPIFFPLPSWLLMSSPISLLGLTPSPTLSSPPRGGGGGPLPPPLWDGGGLCPEPLPKTSYVYLRPTVLVASLIFI